MSGLGRQIEGPKPGTLLITLELPPDTDPDTWYKLIIATGNIARAMVPKTYVHGNRLMETKGKHAAANDNLRVGN